MSIIFCPACSNSQSYPERSLNELAQAGFYTYIFSDTYAAQFSWNRVLELWSFDKHCSDFFQEDTWNPILITYTDNSHRSFEIRISPQDAIWDLGKSTNTISLDADWIPNGTGEYYLSEMGETQLKIVDRFGMDVVISSSLELAKLAELVINLEYAGPDPATIRNPWQDACNR